MTEIKILSDVVVEGVVKTKAVASNSATSKVVVVAADGSFEYRNVGDFKNDVGVNGKLGKNDNAVSATKATNDSSNRNIVNTYSTKGELSSGLGNKVDKVSGKGLSENDFTDALLTKLNGIATSADVNVIESVKVNGTALTPSSKAVDVKVPTKVSQLSNDSNFATKSYVDGKVGSVYKVQGSCTTAKLPTKPAKGDVWNLTDGGKYGGVGTNVVWNGTEWDALGGTTDLSSYATTAYVNGKVGELNKSIGGKVSALSAKPKAGTYTKVTINAEGQVTAGSGMSSGDIPALDASKITSGAFNADRIPVLGSTKIADKAVVDSKIVSVAGSKVTGQVKSAAVPIVSQTISSKTLAIGDTAIQFTELSTIFAVDVKIGDAKVIVPYTISGNTVTVQSSSAETVDITATGLKK